MRGVDRGDQGLGGGDDAGARARGGLEGVDVGVERAVAGRERVVRASANETPSESPALAPIWKLAPAPAPVAMTCVGAPAARSW